ncbi:uncharacterized protein Nmag_1902 [Natrialba magadii ATCC 43099]|uniref:Uncharacterized protein n=1 Tax=Natrialba magadii (strain ATCC 43099 / DSM 3394 / CCM 3739 / CIP 104546 / IAM 13178 / JCM 8861 / NBRC 102185 / NCIMB 2190 / MS3) TaxID=547559 RepID=D3SV65_NATMM|nr:hypothetical protein [Natrialba magadii]ADD05473.1 uncharacterized protein Nmag_1902 [Natrialba magadii ATCC 43099]
MERQEFIACSTPEIIVAICVDESSGPSENEEDTSSDSEELIELQHSWKFCSPTFAQMKSRWLSS